MITTTTHSIEGTVVTAYLGIVVGEAIIGANIIKDLFAAVRDVVRGRTGACEEALRTARAHALREMSPKAQELGACAVTGVDIGYEVLGKAGKGHGRRCW